MKHFLTIRTSTWKERVPLCKVDFRAGETPRKRLQRPRTAKVRPKAGSWIVFIQTDARAEVVSCKTIPLPCACNANPRFALHFIGPYRFAACWACKIQAHEYRFQTQHILPLYFIYSSSTQKQLKLIIRQKYFFWVNFQMFPPLF